jgi:hypothetical protein
MKKSLKIAGIVALAAGVLYYPALQLYKYMAKKRAGDSEHNEGEEVHIAKAFIPAYRGKHKPHHRHEGNGHHDHQA